MNFLCPAFFCAFLNFLLLLAQATPPKSDDKRAIGGKPSSVTGWLKSKIVGNGKEKASSASTSLLYEYDGSTKPLVPHEFLTEKSITVSSPSTHEAEPKKSITVSSPSTHEAEPKKSITVSSPSTHEAEPKKCDLLSRMYSMFCSSEDADIYFLIKEKHTGKEQLFPAHKLNLLAASPVFEKMFEFNGQKKNWTADDPFVVTDISIQTFQIMLRFIYTDNFSEVNEDNLLSVLHAADQYEVIALINECVAFPISKKKNIFLTLTEAQYIGVQAFIDRCFDYIDQNALSLLRSDEFLVIDQPMLCQILQRDQLETHDEIAIWHAALRWADNKCRKCGKEITGANRREMLGPALYKIRFQTIPLKYFTRKIVSTGVLTNAEVISVFLFRSLSGKNLPENPYKTPFSAAPSGNINNNLSGRCWIRSGTIIFTDDKLREFLIKGKKGDYYSSDAIYIMGIQCKSIVKVDDYSSGLHFFLKCEPPAGNQDQTWSLSCSTKIETFYWGQKKYNEMKKFVFSAGTTKLDYDLRLHQGKTLHISPSIQITVEEDDDGFGVCMMRETEQKIE